VTDLDKISTSVCQTIPPTDLVNKDCIHKQATQNYLCDNNEHLELTQNRTLG